MASDLALSFETGTQITDCVKIDNVCLRFGDFDVLYHTQATIPKGTIYALLGPSGCGKTTLLKCVLGQLKPDSGTISVCGKEVKGIGSLEVSIGYMPQEEGLYMSFTIKETVMYFGKLAGMNEESIEKESTHLCQLLKLPQHSKQLTPKLSGGERRRLSLAVALINQPALLILDEPTVGVDVTLRRKIWHYLISLTKENQTTVILTTHYISEAKDAGVVAFMEEGAIVSQAAPQNFFDALHVSTLEQAFLKLCRNKTVDVTQINSNARQNEEAFKTKHFGTTKNTKSRPLFGGLKAHVWKNYVTERHHKTISVFKIFIVMMQVLIFPITFNDNATYIPVTVVDSDGGALSLVFIDSIDKTILEISSEDSFINGMLNFDTDNYALFYFPPNYTENVLDMSEIIRENEGDCNVTSEDFKIHIFADNTNALIRRDVMLETLAIFERMRTANLSKEFRMYLARTEIPFHKVITGDGIERTRNDLLLAGEMIAIIFYMNLFIAAIQLQIEYKNGFLERSLVAGLTVSEMLLSFAVSAIPHAVVETVLLQTVFVYCFDIPITHRWFVWILQMLLGISGTLFGLAMSALSKNELVCLFLLIPVYIDISIISGIFVSSTALHRWFQYFAKVIPTGHPIWSLRYLWHRQWPLANFYVLAGLIPPVASSLIFFFVAAWSLKRKFLLK